MASVMCVVQRAPGTAPDVPDARRVTAADHDARSFDVVAIDYEGHVYPVTDEPGGRVGTRGPPWLTAS